MKAFARYAVAFAIGISTIGTAVVASAAPLVITTEDYPPFNMPKGTDVSGMSTDILKKALEIAKVESGITVYPWKRAYDMALNDSNTCVYSTTLTDQRQPLFKWIGPLVQDNWVLFAKGDSQIKISSLDDAKQYTIGSYLDDAKSQFLKDKGMKVDEAATDTVNPKKLDAGRIDLWVSGVFSGPYIANQQGVTGLKPVFTIKDAQMYLACNKGVPDDVVTKLNDTLKQMASDGTTAGLQKAYQ